MRYRVLGDHINKHADDYIYILCSDSTDGLPERIWPISEEDTSNTIVLNIVSLERCAGVRSIFGNRQDV